MPVDQATPTYWTVTVSLEVTAGPVPVMRSLLCSTEGGAPVGTVTVGLVSNDPAGEGSATGGRAEAEEPGVVVPVVLGAEVVAGAEVVEVVEGDEELLHPASPTAATARVRRTSVRRRDIVRVVLSGRRRSGSPGGVGTPRRYSAPPLNGGRRCP